MTKAALSLFVYGIYLLVNGVGLAVAPNLQLALLGLAPTEEPWIRVVGLVISEIGFYFVFAARRDIASLFQVTVYARGAAALVFAAFVALKLGPVQLLLFAAVDLMSAFWTHFAIRSKGAA
jgi:hypothetical protein